MTKVNLGCGGTYFRGWLNVDSDPSSKADVIHDINKAPLPVKSEYIWADNVLEHLEPIGIINIYESLVEGGVLEGVVPHGLGMDSMFDFTHRVHFNSQTFENSIFQRFKVEYVEVNYRPTRYFGVAVPTFLARLHEHYLPGIMPPSNIKFKLRR